jgi:hypothetical protein
VDAGSPAPILPSSGPLSTGGIVKWAGREPGVGRASISCILNHGPESGVRASLESTEHAVPARLPASGHDAAPPRVPSELVAEHLAQRVAG